MNSYDVNQLDKLELKRIAIGKKLHKGDSSVSVADDLTINRDLFVDRDIHIVNTIQLGKYTDYGQEMPGAMKVVGTLSVSGHSYLGTNVQTTTVRNDIVVEDTLSVAGSVTVATCQNELPSNFMEFTRTRHATDDNTHVLIEKGDSLGSILFKGSDGTDWKKYVDIQTLSTSVEQDNEGGKIQFNILSGGGVHSGDDGTTNTSDMFNLFSIGGENKAQGINNEVVVNEAGINTDFRVESDLNENMIFVDSLANKIGIARDSPQYTLDIQGNSRISDHLLLNTISVGADSHGTHKAVIREDLGGSDMSALIYNTQLALFSTAKQSMNMGVMTDGKGVIQVIDNNNPSITYADLGIQPLGGQIAIGKQLANVVLDIEATDSIRIPVGTVAERPTANSSNHTGYLRYNSELKRFEGYGQSHNQGLLLDEWVSLGGLKDVDNDTYITVENQHGSDNDQIKFFVEDRQEMTLDKSGYLGIGITNPTTRLHVESNDPSYNNTEPIALFRSANKDTSVRIEGTGESYLELANVNTTGDATNSWGIGINNDKNLYFNWKTNSTLDSDTNINERNAMTIMQNGNIGINTIEPKVTFEITGEDALRIPVGNESEKPSLANTMVGQIRYNSQINRFEGYGQSQDQQAAINEWISLSGLKDADNDTYITVENSGNADNDEIKFFTSGNERAIIKSDGKIGINDSGPSEMLDVTGNIRATGHIKVEPSGSPNYSTKMIEVMRENDSWNPVTIEQTHDTRENSGWGAGQLEFKTRNGTVDGSNTLTTPATTKMMITSDGRIGMGDITVTPTDVKLPTARLHVYDNTEGEESMFVLQRNITNFGGNNDGPSMEFRIHDTTNNNQLTQAKILTYDSGVGGSNSAGLSFQTRTSSNIKETLRIAHDGRIAVGNGLENFDDSQLFENKTRISVTSGGILLKNYQGNFTADQRIQISNSVLENEISGIGGGSHAADVGHLRLSAGGGTSTSNKSYIDLYGYESNIITFGTKGTERAVIDEVGRVGIGNTNPSSYLHVEATGAQEPIALFKSTNNDSSVRIEGTGESYLELANVNTTGDSSNSWGIGMNNDKNLYFNWKTNSTLDSDTNVNERNAMTIMQNGNIGINKLVPNVTFDIEGEDAIRIPRGTTAQRPTTLGLGQIRYNTQLHTFEGYGAGNAWGSLGGVKDVDRDTYITAEDSAGADNDELKFYTNQFEENVTPTTVPRMIIKNDGKIGVHTSAPLVKFQVTDQSVLTGTDITNGTASIYGTSGQSSYQILNVSHTNQSEYISIGFNEIAKQGTYDGPLKINNKKNNDIVFGTHDADRMILKSDGKLGLGVISPDTLLHVQKSGAQEPIAIFESTNNDSSIRIQGKGESYLEIANTDTTGDSTNSWGIGMNDDKNLYFNWKTNGTLNYDTNINERNAMTIMQNGNVGINKAIPNVTLDIEGEDAIRIPRGNTAQRPTTLGLGQIRYNTQLHTFEGYGAGNAWGSLGGVKDVDRDTYITAEDSAGADNDELKFYTGQFEETVTATTVPRMIIKNDGKVGINIISPLYKTHINGNVGVEDSVTLQDTLSVSGTTNLTGNTIIGSKATTTHQLHVEGTTNITGATTLDNTLDVTGASILNSTLSVSGISRFSSDLTTVGKISARHTTQNVGVEITPFGGNTATNGGGRVFFRESHNSNNYGFSLGFNGGDGLNPSNLAWPSNTFCISRHNGNSSGDVVLSIDRTSNNVGLGTGIPTSNLHIKQTSGSNDCMIKIEADGGTGSNKPNTGIEFITNYGVPNTPTSSQSVYTSSKILSGWNQGEGSYNQSFFKIQTHHQDSTLNDSFTIKGPDVGINNNSPQFTLDIDGTLNTTGATTLKNTLEVTGATTLKSTLDVTGSTFINNNVGIRTTPGTNCSLDIASISDTQDNIVRIRQPSTSHNSQIRFTRVDINGNDYGPEILYDKNQSPTHSVDSLNLISTNGSMGMNITWDGKVGIGGVNSTGENLYVNGTFRASNNSDIGGTLDVTGATTLNNGLTVTGGVTTIGSSTSHHLRVKGNDIALGQNAGPTSGRALVHRSVDNTLIINYNNDFSNGVRIGGEQEGGPASNLTVTGATTLSSTLGVTGNTTLDGELTVGDPAHEKLKIHIDNINKYAILEYTPKNVQGTLLGKGELSFGGSQTNLGHSTGDIQFNTASANRMIIKNDGNVGIGTNTPTSKLHVMGEIFSSVSGNPNPTGISIIPHGTGTANVGGRIAFLEDTSTIPRGFSLAYNGGSGLDNTTFTNSLPSDTFGILRHNANSGAEASSASLVIKRDNGNVGIGTTSPTTKLHIYDDIANTSNTASTNLTNQMLILETKYNHDWDNPHSGNPNGAPHIGGCGITFKISDNNNSHYGEINYIGRGVLGEGTSGEDDGALQFKVSNNSVDSGGGTTEVMRIDYNGNVGIGNNNPEKKLDVSGTFRATGITTLSNTLEVTGATTLSDTLGVTKATTLSNTLGVSGHTTLNTLGVTGATTIGGETQINNNLLKVIGTQPVFRLSRNSYDGSSSDSVGGTIALGNKDFDEAQIHSITKSNAGNTHMGALCLSTKTHTIMKEAIYIKPPTYAGPSPQVHTNANYDCGNVGIGTTSPNHKLDVNGTIHVNDHLNIEPVGDNTKLIDTKRVSDSWTPVQISQSHAGSYGGNLLFKTHNDNGSIGNNTTPTTKMFIHADGNVGIGTESPSKKLHVMGEIFSSVSGNPNLTGISIIPHGSGTSNVGGRIAFIEDTSTTPRGFSLAYNGGSGLDNATFTNSLPDDTFGILRHDANSGAEASSASLVIKRDNGNVGIGTTSPLKKFQVNGTSRLGGDASATWFGSGEFYINHGSNTALGTFSELRANDTRSISISSSNHIQLYSTDDLFIGRVGGSYSSHFNHGTTQDTFIRSGLGTGKVMIQDTGGNVGIGTTDPQNKLEVAGSMSVTHVRATGVPGPNNLKPSSGGFSTAPALYVGKCIPYQSGNGESALELGVLNSGWGNHGGTLRYRLSTEGGPHRQLKFNIERVDCSAGGYFGDPVYSKVLTMKQDSTSREDMVGISQADPTHKLDVNGTFRATGATTIGSTLDVTGNANFGSNHVSGNLRQRGGTSLTTTPDNYIEWYDTISATETSSNRQAWVGFNNSNQFEITNQRGTLVKINDNTEVGGTLDVTNATTIGGNLTVNGSELVVNGNLIVEGTLNKKNTTELLVEDKTITLSSGATSNLTANGSGIIIDAGSNTNKEFKYNSTGDKFTTNIPLEVGGTFSTTGATTIGSALNVNGAISSTGNITTSGILTCNELRPGLGDISSSYSANDFPSGLGIKLNFGRGFSQSIGSTWTANFNTPNYADEIMFNSYQSNSSGGGPTVLSITRANKLRMAVKRADWTNRSQGFGGNTKSNQNYREVVLYDHDNLLNTNGNAKVNGTLETTGNSTFGGNVGIGTTNPQQALEVHGNILLGENGVRSFIHGGTETVLSSDSGLRFIGDSNGTSGSAANEIVFGFGSNADTDSPRNFSFDSAFGSNGLPRNEAMRIKGSNLCVGIGNVSPEKKLDVSGTFRATGATTLSSTLLVTGVTTIGDQLHVRGNDIAIGPNAGPTAGRALVKSGNRLVINYNNDFSDGVRIGGDNDNTPASNLIVTGTTTLNSTLSVASDVKVDGHILLQGGKKFHIGRNNNNTPDPSADDTIFLISGKHTYSSTEAATGGVMFKIQGYNNEDTSQKIIRYVSENSTEDYYFKSRVSGSPETSGGFHYYNGSIGIGTEDTSAKLNVAGTTKITGTLTVNGTSSSPITFSGTSSDSQYNQRTASGGIASYAFRFKATNATQDQKLFTSDISPYGNRYVQIFNGGKGISAYTGSGTSGYTHNINSDNSQYFQNNQYHHIVVSAQTPFTGPASTNYKVYVDGALILTVSGITTQEQYTSFITTFNLGVGMSSSDPLTGEMKDIYLFDSTITAAQATELNNGTLPSALSGNVVYSAGAGASSSSSALDIKGTINCKLGDLDCGIKIIPQAAAAANTNAGGRIFFKEDSGGDNMGFSLAYNGGNDLQTIGSVLPDDTFGIIRHSYSASGEVVLSIDRDSGIVKINNTLDMNNNKITNVVDPTSNQDAATKKYVDDNSGGSSFNNITESGSITTITGETTFIPTGGGNASHFNYSSTGNTHIRSKSYTDMVYIQDQGGNAQVGSQASGGNLGIGGDPGSNRFYVVGTSRFTDNVGIGAAPLSPGYGKLYVYGSARIDGNANTLQLVGTNHNYIEFYPQGKSGGRKAYIGTAESSDPNKLILQSNGETKLDAGGQIRLDAGGPIELNAGGSNSIEMHASGRNAVSHQLRFTSDGSASWALTATNPLFTCVVHGKIYATWLYYSGSSKESDRRIKKDIKSVSPRETLDIIHKLNLRKFGYIYRQNINGEFHKGEREYGFIAQEVMEHYPSAVNMSVNFIPNVHKFYSNNEEFIKECQSEEYNRPFGTCEYIYDNDEIYLKIPIIKDSEADTVNNIYSKIKIYVCESLLIEPKEMKVYIHHNDETHTYIKVEKEYYYVYIYGMEVDDFHNVDSDSISYLYHQAIQDIDTVQQAELSKVENLETQNTELLSKVNNLETENTQLKDKVTDLENQIKAIKEHLGI